MLDDNLHIKKEEAKVYPPLPKNIYQVELLEIGLKDAKGKFAREGEKNFTFQFTLLGGKDKDGNDLRGRNIWDNFVKTSLFVGKNGKNNLWQIVEAFLGRDLTPIEEAEGITGKLLNSFIGKQIKIFVDQTIKDGNTWNRITSYIHADTQLTPLSEKEKDDATVKNKKETEELPSDEYVQEGGHVEDSIDVEIPF